MNILAYIAEAKQEEYIIALLGLLGFIAFWRVLIGPTGEMREAGGNVTAFTESLPCFLASADFRFHPGHAWARLEGTDTVTVGMDDFAAKLLGSAESISLPKVGSRLKQGSLGWRFKTESRAIHMLSPVEGEVVAVNNDVAQSPCIAFEDPYGNGWLFKVKSNSLTSNMKNMIPSDMVGRWVENVRLILASKGLAPDFGPLLADSDESIRGIAKTVDPERWDDLAREFFLTK